MLGSIIDQACLLIVKKRVNVEKENIKETDMNLYEIKKNAFRYFVLLNDTAIKCFDTYDEAFDYCVEHANAD